MTRTELLAYYAKPGSMTDAGPHASQLAALPDEVGALARTIQGLLIYDVVAADFYGVKLSNARQEDIHLRSVQRMLDAVLALDPRAIGHPRPNANRLAGRCDHYARLLTAMLRVKGIPARARCGFADYFNPGKFEDHWLCEYWNGGEGRWVLVDAQLDEVWREKMRLGVDPLDIPRARFVVAGEAWQQCRTNALDASRFGISFANLSGLWFVAGNVVRDLAALNKVEMLPWDVWGRMPRADSAFEGAQIGYFDEPGRLARDPDAHFAEIRARYDTDNGLRVPAQVFNAMRGRMEGL